MNERIDFREGRWIVPDRPVIPFIEGDGTGPDIWRAARRVFDAVVQKTSGGRRRVDWLEVLAGEKAFKQTGSWLPEQTLEAIRAHRVANKRSEEHTSELQSLAYLVCRLLLEKKKKNKDTYNV